MKIKLVYPLFIVLFLSFIAGCYTVVEHPDVVTKDENGYTYTEEVYFYDNCNSCHKEMAPRNYTAVEKLKMAKTHREEADGTGYSEDSRSRSDYYYDGYYNDSYYSSPYYGDYGYYYSYPWWYNVAPVVSSDSEKDRKTASEYKGSRNNDGGRGNDGRNSSDGGRKGVDISLPTVNAGSSSGSSGNDSKKGSSDNNGRSSTSSSTRDSERGSSSGNSNPRNNDGGRGSSGRR